MGKKSKDGDRNGRINKRIEVEFDPDDHADDGFGESHENAFGKSGPFGSGGPFGPDGVFGPGGLFGPGGVFGQGGGYGWQGGRGRKGGGGGGMRRRERMFGPGELRLVLLSLTAEEPRHGYDCIRAIEEATGGVYAPSAGVVYPTLAMLADEGMIAEQDSDDSRKVFAATAAGREELESRQDELEPLLERFGRKAEKAKAARSSDMMRALGNLAAVLTNKASNGGLEGMSKEQIVDLIDELARKIERM